MKPYLSKNTWYRLKLCTAALIAAISWSFAIADELDNAITLSESRPSTPLISRESYLRPDPITGVELSPSGEYIAYQLRRNDLMQLWLFDIGTKEHQLLYSSKNRGDLRWSEDSQILFIYTGEQLHVTGIDESAKPSILANFDADEDEYFYGVDSFDPQAGILSQRSEDGEEVVLYRARIDGTREELFRSIEPIGHPLFSSSGQLAFYTRLSESSREIISLVGEQEEIIYSCPSTILQGICELKHYSEPDNTLYFHAHVDRDLSGLYKFNTLNKNFSLIHSDPEQFSDGAGYLLHRETGMPIAGYYRYDFTRSYGLTEKSETHLTEIEEQISSRNLGITPDENLQRWLIRDFDPDRATNTFYLYDSISGVLSRPLQGIYEQFDAQDLPIAEEYVAEKVPVHYFVSDGMQQQGYLTLPSGIELASAPLVVYPHGGPWARVYGNYDAVAQLLANRGYVVFQPNFRSSTGFGQNYMTSGFGEYGDGRVQQDIIDGLNYVLSRGIGDPEKLGIVGGSFGGFSTLNGLSFTPDLFQVGVALAAPSDFSKTIVYGAKTEFLPEEFAGQFTEALGADPEDFEQMAELSRKSPGSHAEQIVKPIYLWGGVHDDRVSILNLKDYGLRLREADKQVMLMVDNTSGHNAGSELAREASLYIFEKALADHLGGRLETELSPELERFLNRSVLIDENNFL